MAHVYALALFSVVRFFLFTVSCIIRISVAVKLVRQLKFTL